MAELLATLVAALVGVVIDRVSAWHTQRRAHEAALLEEQLTRRAAIEQINQRIDREIYGETNLDALVDRL